MENDESSIPWNSKTNQPEASSKTYDILDYNWDSCCMITENVLTNSSYINYTFYNDSQMKRRKE